MSAPNLLLLRLAEFLRTRRDSIVTDSIALLEEECLQSKDHFPWDKELTHLVQETADRLLASAAAAESQGETATPAPPSGVQSLLLESSLVRNAFVRALNRFQIEQSGQHDYTALEMTDARQATLDEFDHLFTAALSQWICGKDSRPGIRIPMAMREVYGGLRAVQGLLRLASEQVPAGSRIHVSAAVQQLGRIATELQQALGITIEMPATPEPPPPVRREPLRLAPVHVSSFVRTLSDAFRPAAEQKGLRFESRCGPKPEIIHTDAAKLHRAATLILDHSVNATASGSIVVTAGLNSSDGWTLGVRDTSPGLSPEILSRTLLGLAQAEEHSSLGDSVLGIALARDLADLLGGSLEAESKAGDGTQFRIMLPVN